MVQVGIEEGSFWLFEQNFASIFEQVFGDFYWEWAQIGWDREVECLDFYGDQFEDEWASVEKVHHRPREMEWDEIWGYWGITFQL